MRLGLRLRLEFLDKISQGLVAGWLGGQVAGWLGYWRINLTQLPTKLKLKLKLKLSLAKNICFDDIQ